jgi:tetratricopeptide (TPR) repeat protein
MAKKPAFDYDVFFSYSSRDKDWVHGELLERIEQAGLRAFIDFRDFTPGAPSIKECERGVLKCRKTLLVLTPEYLKSEWCEFEAVLGQTRSPANRDLRMIPLLRKQCKKPARLGALTHIDFTESADQELAWRQLFDALRGSPQRTAPRHQKRDQWHLPHTYPLPQNFTGRLAEHAMLTSWLLAGTKQPLLILRALGGFGKSALVWHWLMHDVEPDTWPRVVWWSFYEGDASFDNFLASTVEHLSGNRPLSTSNHREAMLRILRQPGTLLVLDGFERALRAFGGLDAAYQGDDVDKSQPNERDCISPIAEMVLRDTCLLPEIQAKVLLTTRLTPRVLEARDGGLINGCREQELMQMDPADAVDFFGAQGVLGTRTEIEAACDPYGYHPLSLCLLAGLIVSDLQQPGDITCAERLDVSGDLVQRQHHVLEAAYNSLSTLRQKLLSQIACFRGPVSYDALTSLAMTTSEIRTRYPAATVSYDALESAAVTANTMAALDADVRDLLKRGLLHHDTKKGRFDLHPIVRRYAYDRLAAPARAAAHTRLRDYFAAVPKPDKVTRLEDLRTLIELYHHTVRAKQYEDARTLFQDRISDATYYQFCAYQLRIDLLRVLFPDGEDRPPRLVDEGAQASARYELAKSYSLAGQPQRAVLLFKQHNHMYVELHRQRPVAVGLRDLAEVQVKIGALRAAESNLLSSINLSPMIEDELLAAVARLELALLLAYRGEWADSERELVTALDLFEHHSEVQLQGVAWAYRALCAILTIRSGSTPCILKADSIIQWAGRALELADQAARAGDPRGRDFVRAHWLLGAAYRLAGQHAEAEFHLHEALERDRRINLVETEADILIELARLRRSTGFTREAQRLADEALLITERCGYVLQGADARLELAHLAIGRDDKPTAREQAAEARRLASCYGLLGYIYKVAYDEAGALLEQLR